MSELYAKLKQHQTIEVTLDYLKLSSLLKLITKSELVLDAPTVKDLRIREHNGLSIMVLEKLDLPQFLNLVSFYERGLKDDCHIHFVLNHVPHRDCLITAK